MPHPTDDSAEPQAPPSPGPAWRRWRRSLILAAIGLSLGLLVGALGAWYRTDFSMPTLPKTVAGIDLEPVSHWLWMREADLQWWKSSHRTRELELAGTIWIAEVPRGRFTLHFGADGRLRTELPPSTPGTESEWLLSPYSSRNKRVPRTEVAAFLARLDGSRYTFHPDSPWPDRQAWLNFAAEPNLRLLDAPEEAFLSLWCNNSHRMTLFFRSSAPLGANPPVTAHLLLKQVYRP
ncbi:MAG: hypothetical protein JNK37_09070 [Verrucomicrobiales bacterium]|nr:hypothetical protein [Verrucomicrobiales bacterium]